MKKITGIVVEGQKRGVGLGFPTANVQLQEKLESGVYAGFVALEGIKYSAAIFIWPDRLLLEAHISDFSGDLYGKSIEVEIGQKIRDSIKFENDDDLKSQIIKDIEEIRTISTKKLKS